MTLEEVFKGNEHLLEEPAVKLFIEEVRRQTLEKIMYSRDFYNKVFEAIVYSNRFLKGGTSDAETIEKIEKLCNDF